MCVAIFAHLFHVSLASLAGAFLHGQCAAVPALAGAQRKH